MTKKLIEVTLPLEAINVASAEMKGNSPLKGQPRDVHQWWARRPLAAARAVCVAQMVDDRSHSSNVISSDVPSAAKLVVARAAREAVHAGTWTEVFQAT